MKSGVKLLMSCDDYIYFYDGAFYAGSQERADFYQRYLRVFDKLRLVTRCQEVDMLSPDRVKLDPRIEYTPVPFFRGPKEFAEHYFKIGQAIRGIADGCDAAVLRLPSTVAMRVFADVKRAGIPYATEIVYDACDGYSSSESLVHKMLWKYIDRKMRSICYKADGVSCVTEYYLQQRYFTKKPRAFSTHYSSLALPASFYGESRSFPHQKRLKIAHVANQVEFNGRKGHMEIIEALTKLKEQNIYVDVEFAGGDYFGGVSKLEEYANSLGVGSQVRFVGYLDRTSLDQFLTNADLFVLPTKAEGLPRVIIEAMSKGLPCISTTVSGNPELLGSHWLIDYKDVDLLVERIKELCVNPQIYEETSAVNFKNSWKYEASILEKRRDKFYEQLKSITKQ